MQTEQSARSEAGAVVESVKDETKTVAQEAQQQARTAAHQIQNDVRSRADAEATKFAQTLHETGRQLSSMADAADGQGVAAGLVREGASVVERLGTRLDQGGLDAVMADVRSWARRSPGTFLLGAAAAGFVAGRVARHFSGNGGPYSGNGAPATPDRGAPRPAATFDAPGGFDSTSFDSTSFESTPFEERAR